MNNKRSNDNISFNQRNIVKYTIGTICEMAPLNSPRKIEDILNHINQAIQKIGMPFLNDYRITLSESQFKEWLTTTLMNCKEFCELNLNYYQFTKTGSANDKYIGSSSNSKIFSYRFDKCNNHESWKYDFIDLDACIQNIVYELVREETVQTDCFLCSNKYTNTDLCRNCTLNPEYENNYHMDNMPCDNSIPRWCGIFECKNCKAICCVDCDEYNTCDDVCSSAKGKVITSPYTTIIDCEDIVYREECTDSDK